MTVRNQGIFKAIQVHVHEHDAPGPFTRLQSAELRNLGVSPITAIQEQRVALHLRAAVGLRHVLGILACHRALPHPARVVAAQHIEDEKVVGTVAIDVGKIDAHRKRACLP